MPPVCVYLVCTSCLLTSGGNAHVQNGVSGSYMDAIYEIVAHESEMDEVYQGKLLRLVEFVSSLDMSAKQHN